MASIQAAESSAKVCIKGQVHVEVLPPGSPQAAKGARWVCFDTAVVITPSCPFGGCAMNVLLLLMLVKPYGPWLVVACYPHLCLSVQSSQVRTHVSPSHVRACLCAHNRFNFQF